MDGRVQVDDVGWRFASVEVSRQSLQDTQNTCQPQSSAGTTKKEQQERGLEQNGMLESLPSFKPPMQTTKYPK